MGTSGWASLWHVGWSHNRIEGALLFYSLEHVWWKSKHPCIPTWWHAVRCWRQRRGLWHNCNTDKNAIWKGDRRADIKLAKITKQKKIEQKIELYQPFFSRSQAVPWKKRQKIIIIYGLLSLLNFMWHLLENNSAGALCVQVKVLSDGFSTELTWTQQNPCFLRHIW